MRGFVIWSVALVVCGILVGGAGHGLVTPLVSSLSIVAVATLGFGRLLARPSSGWAARIAWAAVNLMVLSALLIEYESSPNRYQFESFDLPMALLAVWLSVFAIWQFQLVSSARR